MEVLESDEAEISNVIFWSSQISLGLFTMIRVHTLLEGQKVNLSFLLFLFPQRPA